jgi:DNA-binding PadR family transcriptional regulator
MPHDLAAVRAQLPLHPHTFHILVALAAGDQHGYAILQDVEARTQGAVKLSAGGLYRSIHRLLEEGLITEPRRLPVPGDDPRRRYYRLTSFGRAVALAETRRLDALVRLARHSGLVPRPT